MKLGKVLMALTYLVCMLAMISDYKVLCNLIGSFTTVFTLFYLLFSKKKKSQSLEKQTFVFLVIFLLYFTITSLVNFNPKEWGVNFLVYLIVFTPFLLNMHLEMKGDVKLMKTFVGGFFIIWTIFLVICYITCLLVPNLARMMAADRPSFSFMINGGGYYMGNGSAILIAYLYNSLIRGEIKGKIYKIFVLFEIILMIATILVINSFVILVSTIIGIVVVTINRFIKSKNSRAVVYIFSGCLALLIYANIGSILEFIIQNNDNEFWNKRFEETYDAVIEGENSAHVDARDKVYQISKEGFIESPIWGTGYRNGNVFVSEGENGIGNHSTILDSLAQFGIIGSLPLFLFLLYPLRRAQKRGENWDHLIPFFVMAYLNPVLKCYHVMVILFLIIPCMNMLKLKPK